MTRPPGDVPGPLHGAMKDVGGMYGLSAGETYELAAALLVTLEPTVDYESEGPEELVPVFLEKCRDRAETDE